MYKLDYAEISLLIVHYDRELKKEDWRFIRTAIEVGQHIRQYVVGQYKTPSCFRPTIEIRYSTYQTSQGVDGVVGFYCHGLFPVEDGHFFGFTFRSVKEDKSGTPRFLISIGGESSEFTLDVKTLKKIGLKKFIRAVKSEQYISWLTRLRSDAEAEKDA